MTALIPYDQARHALAAAKAVDDVKDILDKAEAMRIYAKRAENRDLEIDAAEIRMFAERRLGQMIAAQKATVGLNRGVRGSKVSGSEKEPVMDDRPKLADIGISKKLSSRAQKMAAVPPEKFEAMTKAWRQNIVAENERVTTDLLRVGQEEQQRQARRDLSAALSDTSLKLTGRRRVGCIYADPAWRRKAGDGNRSYENHYRTMTWDEIIAMPIADLLLPDAWGFIWIPRAHMLALHTVNYKIDIGDGEIVDAPIKTPLIWAIARAWGFDNYSTCFVWTKTDEEHENDIGTGLVVRDQDEILCLFKKGRGLPKPSNDEKFGSNHRERSRPLGHSRKPQFYRDMIASMTGGVPALELFGRADPEFQLPTNWEMWGNQATPNESEAA
jgi:N6-adenosine-specific RNA methylase IME4